MMDKLVVSPIWDSAVRSPVFFERLFHLRVWFHQLLQHKGMQFRSSSLRYSTTFIPGCQRSEFSLAAYLCEELGDTIDFSSLGLIKEIVFSIQSFGVQIADRTSYRPCFVMEHDEKSGVPLSFEGTSLQAPSRVDIAFIVFDSSADRLGWLRGLGMHGSRQHQASSPMVTV